MSKSKEAYKKLTQEYLNSLFIYEPETGILRNKIDRHKNKTGTVPGYIDQGYRVLHLDNYTYAAHRLIWLMMTGDHVPDDIDHIDRNRSNNCWNNLRLAKRFQNTGNYPIPKTNTSGVKGVHWHKPTNKWRAQIKKHNKVYHLGLFDNIQDAAECYRKAAIEHFKEFASFV